MEFKVGQTYRDKSDGEVILITKIERNGFMEYFESTVIDKGEYDNSPTLGGSLLWLIKCGRWELTEASKVKDILSHYNE
jgi:hypothetical protein